MIVTLMDYLLYTEEQIIYLILYKFRKSIETNIDILQTRKSIKTKMYTHMISIYTSTIVRSNLIISFSFLTSLS